jgi:hypothetical protein
VSIARRVHERHPNAAFDAGSWRAVYQLLHHPEVNNETMEQ